MNKNFIALALLTAFCAFFPKCGTSSTPAGARDNGAGSGESVILIDGRPVVSESEFQKKIEQVCAAQPNIRQVLFSLAADQQRAFFAQLADAVLAEELVKRFVKEQGLTSTPEFIQSAQEAHALVETQLINNMFQTALLRDIQAALTDAQAEQFYMENRDRVGFFKRPPFVEKAGGAVLSIVEGLSERQAQEIVQQSKSVDLLTLARGLQKKVKDLGLVNSRSTNVDEAVRGRAATITSVPLVEAIKLSNGKYAVIKAREDYQDTYLPYQNPEVMDAVKNFMIRNELGKAMQKTLEELKQKYQADIRQDVLAKFVKVEAPVAPAMAEEQEAARPQAVQAA